MSRWNLRKLFITATILVGCVVLVSVSLYTREMVVKFEEEALRSYISEVGEKNDYLPLMLAVDDKPRIIGGKSLTMSASPEQPKRYAPPKAPTQTLIQKMREFKDKGAFLMIVTETYSGHTEITLQKEISSEPNVILGRVELPNLHDLLEEDTRLFAELNQTDFQSWKKKKHPLNSLLRRSLLGIGPLLLVVSLATMVYPGIRLRFKKRETARIAREQQELAIQQREVNLARVQQENVKARTRIVELLASIPNGVTKRSFLDCLTTTDDTTDILKAAQLLTSLQEDIQESLCILLENKGLIAQIAEDVKALPQEQQRQFEDQLTQAKTNTDIDKTHRQLASLKAAVTEMVKLLQGNEELEQTIERLLDEVEVKVTTLIHENLSTRLKQIIKEGNAGRKNRSLLHLRDDIRSHLN